MESTPPPVPTPVSPGDGARIGVLGDVTPTLKWASVTDPSGVTYTLQIDTSPDFAHPVLEKTDISGTQYTLAVIESLPRGEYYWRVKAVDGASNESAWSQPRLLRSGLMPLWTLILLIVVAVAVVAAVIYFALARLAVRRRAAIPVPEVEMPQVIPGRWRLIGGGEEATKERPFPGD